MASEDPGSAATLVFRARTTPEMEGALKKIRFAWVAALISASITLIASLLAMRGSPVLGLTVLSLVDVALLLGLAFGIWRKSRTCAVIMLLYFVASKILQFSDPTGSLSQAARVGSIPMTLIFLYLYWQGVAGTFAFHRLQRDSTAA